MAPDRVAGAKQRLAVVRPDIGQIGVELDGLGEVGERGRIFARLEFGGAQQQPGLGRVAIPQDAIDEDLAAGHLVVADQRRPEHVRNRKIVRPLLRDGDRAADHLFVLAEAQPAIGQQQRRLQFAGGGPVDLFEARPPLPAGRSCSRQRQVQFDRRVSRLEFQCPAVLRDGVLVAADARIGRRIRAEWRRGNPTQVAGQRAGRQPAWGYHGGSAGESWVQSGCSHARRRGAVGFP